MAQKSFNWDDISVGCDELDHSQNFFAKKHIKHERLCELAAINEGMAAASIVDKENVPSNAFHLGSINNKLTSDEPEIPSPPGTKANDERPATVKLDTTALVDVEVVDGLASAAAGSAQADANVTVKPTKPPSNVRCQWSTQKVVVTKGLKTARGAQKVMPPPPNAYKFADVYQRRKEEALQRRLEEEKKKREFHSRPAPNLQRIEENRPKVHRVTVPVTPKVLKTSRETDLKRKQKLEEWKRKQKPEKFEARVPTILQEEPFIPKKTQTVIQQVPFNLHVENRLRERKQYNAGVNGAIADKKKQVDTVRKFNSLFILYLSNN